MQCNVRYFTLCDSRKRLMLHSYTLKRTIPRKAGPIAYSHTGRWKGIVAGAGELVLLSLATPPDAVLLVWLLLVFAPEDEGVTTGTCATEYADALARPSYCSTPRGSRVGDVE